MNEEYLRFNDQGLAEVNPMASYNAQNEFIDNYRNLQSENTAQIGTQTHALGSDLPAQTGGLHGPSEYWKSRYQTPQTESRLASLRTANQLQALNQLMQNDLANETDKYNQAARAAQQRANSSTSNSNNTTDDTSQGEVIYQALEDLGRAGKPEAGISTVYDADTGQPTNTTVIAPEGVDEDGNARAIILDNETGVQVGTSEVDNGSDVARLNAANGWAQTNHYGSWSDYIAHYTDDQGNLHVPDGMPSDFRQFSISRTSSLMPEDFERQLESLVDILPINLGL